jgi:serine/threonine-protein kinase RsbW
VAIRDEVRLSVPAAAEFLRLARVTAAGLASRLGFSFDEVEDLRLAIDELCFGLTGSARRDGTVHVRYVLDGDRLVVEGQADFRDARPDEVPTLSELSEVILGALVDEHRLEPGVDGARFYLVKRHHEATDALPGGAQAGL